MLGAERLLLDFYGAQVKGCDLCVAVLLAVALSQEDRHRGNKKIIAAKRLLHDGQSAFEERLGLGVAMFLIKSEGFPRQRCSFGFGVLSCNCWEPQRKRDEQRSNYITSLNAIHLLSTHPACRSCHCCRSFGLSVGG